MLFNDEDNNDGDLAKELNKFGLTIHGSLLFTTTFSFKLFLTSCR